MIELFARSTIPQGRSSFIRSSPLLQTWRPLRLCERPRLSDLPLFSELGVLCGSTLLTTLSPSKDAFAARPVEYPFHRSVIFSFTALFHGASPVEYRLDQDRVVLPKHYSTGESHRLSDLLLIALRRQDRKENFFDPPPWRALRLCERLSLSDFLNPNSTDNFKYVWLAFFLIAFAEDHGRKSMDECARGTLRSSKRKGGCFGGLRRRNEGYHGRKPVRVH